MSRNFKRLAVAFILSAGSFYAVEHWYRSIHTNSNVNTTQRAVAKLIQLSNEVQRKPVTRLIWEVIRQNENLYPGEAIRTTATSDATIYFMKTGTTVELEPESQVIIQSNQNEVTLNFVKGNLFVKQNMPRSSPTANIKLQTAKGDIHLKSAELFLSQTNKKLDLEVFKGEAELKKGGKSIKLDKTTTQKKNLIDLIFPLPSESAFINPRIKEPVTFKWNKLPSGYRVFIERGPRRHTMTRYESKWARGDDGKIQIPAKVGKIYWRAVAIPIDPAKSAQTLTSKTTFSRIIPKTPPTLLQPENDQKLILKK